MSTTPDAKVRAQTTGLVLAGGAGARLGGRDKGWLEVGGAPLIARVLARLSPQVGKIIINANRNLAKYSDLKYEVIRDTLPGRPGPLAGMASGLRACATRWLLCVPVDGAHLPPNLCANLYAAIRSDRSRAAMVHDGQRLNPVCCLLHRDLAGDLQRAMQSGERSPARWLTAVDATPVRFDDWPRNYWSVNTPQELAWLDHQFSAETA